MKKTLFVLSIVLTLAFATPSFTGTGGKLDLKVGDEIYACNCGEKCPCDTMSRNAGNCTCGHEMVKAKVTKVEEGKASLKADTWKSEKSFKTTGKYACSCECKCDEISQNPGKCTCGVDMKKL